MSTDLIEQAKEHPWWYADINMALNLIHEVERLRGALATADEMRRADEAEIERLRASERSAWNAAVERDDEIERLRKLLREIVLRYAGDEWLVATADRILGDD